LSVKTGQCPAIAAGFTEGPGWPARCPGISSQCRGMVFYVHGPALQRDDRLGVFRSLLLGEDNMIDPGLPAVAGSAARNGDGTSQGLLKISFRG